jgi:hypothetical protein
MLQPGSRNWQLVYPNFEASQFKMLGGKLRVTSILLHWPMAIFTGFLSRFFNKKQLLKFNLELGVTKTLQL